jgi:hypothetical protein
MPELIAAIVPLLPTLAAGASLAGTGVGLGMELSNKPGSPSTPTPSPAVTDATANQAAMNQKALVSQQLPGLQAQTGGSLAPDTLVQLAQLISGQAGTPGASGINADLIKQLGGGSVSAGSTTTSPQTSGLTNSTFG